jgi:hypothetical protein
MPWVGRIRARLVKIEAQRSRLGLKQRLTSEHLGVVREERESLIAAIADRKLRQSRLFRRKQLLSKDWKSFRSGPLAGYLHDVFRELEYAIEKTHTADSHSPELIVSKVGHKLAIRVIGFFDAVEATAVEAAIAAEETHRSEGCAVITNSRFTLAAQERAAESQCVLIDENLFAAMVLGHVDLRDLHSSLQINAELVRERNAPSGDLKPINKASESHQAANQRST